MLRTGILHRLHDLCATGMTHVRSFNYVRKYCSDEKIVNEAFYVSDIKPQRELKKHLGNYV
jgi:hypothetical protein